MISARIIADSKNQFGNRITTFVLTFPRIALAEFNTHRMISKNSASSRAIPFEKMVKMVEENPFIPMKWMKEHKGMQGTEYFENKHDIENRKDQWLTARNNAVTHAQILSSMGVTKQICNRLLEPFLYHTVIATGTEWGNFFALRAHDQAEIHIQDLAFKMLDEYNKSEPKLLKAGEWHIPFGDQIDRNKMWESLKHRPTDDNFRGFGEYAIKIATARCARVSYLNFEGKDDYEADIKLHDRLIESGHMSPMEHCAQSMSAKDRAMSSYNDDDGDSGTWGWSGNFRGFTQYRKMIAYENKTDNRVLQKH